MELTQARAGSAVWWTLGFEATGLVGLQRSGLEPRDAAGPRDVPPDKRSRMGDTRAGTYPLFSVKIVLAAGNVPRAMLCGSPAVLTIMRSAFEAIRPLGRVSFPNQEKPANCRRTWRGGNYLHRGDDWSHREIQYEAWIQCDVWRQPKGRGELWPKHPAPAG